MFAFFAIILIAIADPPPDCPKKEPIQVMVVVILANDVTTDVHEKLAEIAAEVRKKEPKLTGFELHKTINKHLKLGESVQVELIGDAKADLTINEKTDDDGRMTITVKPPMFDEVTYACKCGKFLPFITNYYTPDKKRLIVAVMSKPCKKKAD